MNKTREWRLWAPWFLCSVCITLALVRTIGWITSLEGRPSLYESVEALGWGLAMPALFSVVAALIITRQPRNTVGWLLIVPALVAVVPVSSALQAQLVSPPANPDAGLLFYAWFRNYLWVPVIFPVILIPLHFPDGAPPSPRWRVADYLALVMVTLFTLGTAAARSIFYELDGKVYSLPNLVGFVPDQVLEVLVGVPWILGLLTLVSLSFASLLVRFRRSGIAVRQQIKWLLFACGFFAAVYGLQAVMSDVVPPQLRGWTNLFLFLSVLTIPAAIAIAILRYQLYDIDVIIRKTLLYAILTALLGLVYFGLVLMLQTAFGTVAGEQSPAIVVISTLVIAALFAPLRRRVQEVLDRRFFRKKYDAQSVLAQFAQLVRDETDMDELTAVLVKVIQETIQPERVALWQRTKGTQSE